MDRAMKVTRKKISIVTPCFNEEAGHCRMRRCSCRHIFKASWPTTIWSTFFATTPRRIRTLSILKELAKANRSIKIIVNSRNFGILKNTYNGVLHATGDAVLLFLPADLQDPPALIPQFVELWEQGYEIVYGLRAERDEGLSGPRRGNFTTAFSAN